MFNLLRYFSLASAVALAVVTVVLVHLYRQNAVNELVELAESQNVTLARTFANVLWPRFSHYIGSVSEMDGDALRARPETRELDAALKTLTTGLPVLKVKIYDLDGLTVYSSQPSQMGTDKSNNLGFMQSARDGKAASKLSYRDTFSAFSGTVENRDLVESYLPIWGDGGAIEGVFELYTDVTPLMARVERRTTELIAGLLLSFGLLYGVLFLIVRRADRKLGQQYSELRQAEEALRRAHDELETRVLERTNELRSEITERKRTEQALRDSKERFRDFAETASDWFWETDVHLRFTYFSNRFERSGLGADKRIGKTRCETTTDDTNQSKWRQHLADLAARKPFKNFEHTTRAQDGGLVHVSISGTPVFDAAGNFKGYRGTGTDITARKRVEQALRQSEQRFKDIANSSADWFWELDENGRYTYISERYQHVTGIDPQQALGKTQEEIFKERKLPPEYEAECREVSSYQRERKPYRDIRFKVLLPDGRVRHWRASGWPVFDDKGGFRGYRGATTDITDEVRAEAKVAGAQKQFIAAIESVSDGFALFDADDRMVFCNSRFKVMNLGLAPKLVPGVTFEELLRDNVVANRILDALGDEEAFIRKRMALHQNPSGLLVQERRDGRWLELREERTPEGATFLMNTDITERKQSEEALRESEERFRAVVDHSPTKIHIKDLEGRYLLVNKVAERLFGVSDAEARGKASFDIFSKDQAEAFCRHDRAVLDADCAIEAEEVWVRDDGVQTFLTVKFPIRGASGKTVAVGAIGTDITERKRAENALRESEARFRTLVEHAPEAITMLDVDTGLYVDANPMAEALHGLTRDELIGKIGPADLSPEIQLDGRPSSEAAQGYLSRALAGEFPRFEWMHLDPDGQETLCEVSLARLPDPHRNLVRASITDITDRKSAEKIVLKAREEAELASRAKSEFLANMSHELRTPLNAIIGFSEILQNEMLGPIGNPKYRDYATDISESGQHLLELINDILDLSKIESGTVELREENLDVLEVVRSSVLLLKERAQSGAVSLEQQLPATLPELRGDRRRVKQILVNLLSNAVKFTPPGGGVIIKAWHDPDGGHVLQVTDTGIGMAHHEVGRALAPFEQVDSRLNRKYEGSGLGLTLTKSLVELHGGRLDLQSELGVGTTVTVHFPAERLVSGTSTAA